MKCYCEQCNSMSDFEIKPQTEIFPVYGEHIEIQANVAVCKTCGSVIFNEELDSKNILIAQNEYRKKHKLLTANECLQ